MGQVKTSTLDPSCCFREGRRRTSCAAEKEKPSCCSVTKCLNQTGDTDHTKIKTAQKGQQQSSCAGLKFSSLLHGLCLQEPLFRVPKPMSLQWQHLGASLLLPPELLWHQNPGGLSRRGLRQTPHQAQHPKALPATPVSVSQTQPGLGTEPGKINIYGTATMMLMEGSGISS